MSSGPKLKRQGSVRDTPATAEDNSATPTQWAQVNRAPEYAEHIHQSDLRRGLSQESYPYWLLLIPLLTYGGYLAYCEGCTEEMKATVWLVVDSIKDFLYGVRGIDTFLVFVVLLVIVITVIVLRWPTRVFLVDFAVYRPPQSWKVSHSFFMDKSKTVDTFSEESLKFQEKILASSTLGNDSYFPPGIMEDKVDLSIAGARREADMVMGGAVADLLKRTGTHPRAIDIVVVNCSLFCPTPSLASILVNRFKMRSDVLHFSLGGMGCSASVVAVDLAKRALKTRPNALALVVSTENITQNWYRGNEKSMLLSNCLFRCGAAAMLLSNKSKDKKRSRFELKDLVRVHMGADDEAYKAVYQCQDDKKMMGVALSRKIMVVAGDALRSNITRLGPKVLPWSEQIKFGLNLVARLTLTGRLPIPRVFRKLLQALLLFAVRLPLIGYIIRTVCTLPATAGKPVKVAAEAPAAASKGGKGDKKGSQAAKATAVAPAPAGKPRIDVGKAYVPDFRKAFDFFCVHAGGRAVLDAIEKNLGLSRGDLEPSRYTLARYGNTSSSSIWYELDYIRRYMGLKRGQKVWQIAFGSGFLCNSAVWQSLHDYVPEPKPTMPSADRPMEADANNRGAGAGAGAGAAK